MTPLQALSRKVAELGDVVRALGFQNIPGLPQAEAYTAYKTAFEAWMEAEREFREAVNRSTAPELEALVRG
jgi:hypothetical protein